MNSANRVSRYNQPTIERFEDQGLLSTVKSLVAIGASKRVIAIRTGLNWQQTNAMVHYVKGLEVVA